MPYKAIQQEMGMTIQPNGVKPSSQYRERVINGILCYSMAGGAWRECPIKRQVEYRKDKGI